jgi:hypothetical protein
MTAKRSPAATSAAEESLYTDEQGIPTLFDVVLTGDQMREAGVSLSTDSPAAFADIRTSRLALDVDQRIRAAIDAALPKVTERTAAAMREALLKEVQDTLRASDP